MSATPPEVVQALANYLPAEKLDDAIQILDGPGLAKLELFASELHILTADVSRSPITADGEEARAAELLTRGVAALREIEDLRRKQLEPHTAATRAINSIFATITEPFEALVGKGGLIERQILAWRQAKRARIQREQEESRRKQEEAARAEQDAMLKAEHAKSEAARKKALEQAEVASRAMAAAAVEMPRPMPRGVKTESGTVSTRERYVVQGITDYDSVPDGYKRDPIVLEALRKVLQRAVTSGARHIPGVAIGIDEGLTRRIG